MISSASDAINVIDWDAYIKGRDLDMDAIRTVLAEFHGDGQAMAAEILRLRAELERATVAMKQLYLAAEWIDKEQS